MKDTDVHSPSSCVVASQLQYLRDDVECHAWHSHQPYHMTQSQTVSLKLCILCRLFVLGISMMVLNMFLKDTPREGGAQGGAAARRR